MDKLINKVKRDIEHDKPKKAKKDIKVLLKADKAQDKLVSDCKAKKMKGK